MSLADAPSRSRNTGRKVLEALTIPMNIESACTSRQLRAWVARATAASEVAPPVSPIDCNATAPVGDARRRPRIPDDVAHSAQHRPTNAAYLRRLCRDVRPRRARESPRPPAARAL